MKRVLLLCISVAALLLAGCGMLNKTPEAAPRETAAVLTPAPETAQPTPEPIVPTPTPDPVRQDGERFDAVIMLEGMEETVHYEHIVNTALGFEMDYDYESFVRQREADRETFISVYDKPDDPENFLEITALPQNADAVAAFVSETLSREFDLTNVTRTLAHAGECVRIEASVIKGTNRMAPQLQAVYIIPSGDGCLLATTHAAIEASEGFWRRFDYMLNTLSLLARDESQALTDEQALAAVRLLCMAENPELEGIVNSGEYPVYWEITAGDAESVVVLYRSYTGAQLRYYIDRQTGDAHVTEFVPGITPEEQPTGETVNIRAYLA